jgi:cell division septation protein DedD
VNTRVPQRDRASRSIKPYLAVAACLVVAVVVAFSVIERWTLSPAPEEAGDEGAIEGAGRVVIGRPAGKSPPSSREPSAPGGAYKPEEFTFYKSLGSAPVPEPKLGARPPAPHSVSSTSKAVPAREAPRKSVTGSRTSYTVQVASFQDRATADRLAARLRRDRYVVTVARVVLPDAGVRYRVRVGTFKTRQDALRFADILKTKEKLDPFVALVTTDAPRL